MSMALPVCQPTMVRRRPRFEGSNICTWIGFKHVMYLVEEAVLDHLRQNGIVPRELFERDGAAVDVVDSSVRILHALHMDDEVRIEVSPVNGRDASELAYAVQMFVERDHQEVKSLTGRVTIVARRAPGASHNSAPQWFADASPSAPPPPSAAGDSGRGVAGADDGLIRQVVPQTANAFVWKWHVPYFYCHFTERMQHSGYVRLLEEVVDLFLGDRGISIRTMLQTRQWIPVVPSARVRVLADALMEEPIYTVYTVEDIYKDVTYTARMDCYVVRDAGLVHTATGRITHGYAAILNRRDWSLVNFDQPTIDALRGQRS
jgi:acyl-CoA thioesterase FadM